MIFTEHVEHVQKLGEHVTVHAPEATEHVEHVRVAGAHELNANGRHF